MVGLGAIALGGLVDVVAWDVADARDLSALEGIGIHLLHTARVARPGTTRFRLGGAPVTTDLAGADSQSWHSDVIPA